MTNVELALNTLAEAPHARNICLEGCFSYVWYARIGVFLGPMRAPDLSSVAYGDGCLHVSVGANY